MKVRFLATLSVIVTACATLQAADVWVLRGHAGACGQTAWSTDVLFLNAGTGPETVRLLGVSDGLDTAPTREFDVPPNHLISLMRTAGVNWAPRSAEATYFVHLDVPDDVVVQNVLNVGAGECPLAPATDNSALFGSIALPAFRSLFPAGRTRYFLGTDLGLIDARTNVGVYNAGAESVVADVRLIRGCDGQVIDRATLALAANASGQVSLGGHPESRCFPQQINVQAWPNYVAVTMSQPSLSYVANVVNGEPPRVLLAAQ